MPQARCGWIGVCDGTGLFTDQGRRAVVWPPHILLGALGALSVEGPTSRNTHQKEHSP